MLVAQLKSFFMVARLGSITLAVRVAAQAFRPDRMCGIEHAFENGPLGRDDHCHGNPLERNMWSEG